MPPLNTFTRSCLAMAISQAVLAPAEAANIKVNDSGDSGAALSCTLRQAIVSANNDAAGVSNCVAGAGGDTITFANSVLIDGGISLSQPAVLNITGDLQINGYSDRPLAIDGMGNGGILSITSGTVSLNNLTISNGSATAGGGVSAHTGTTLNLNNCTISGNSAIKGGGVYANYGSNVRLNNSTVSGNSVLNQGGGIYAESASVTIVNSTLSDNSAATGGGIHASSGAIGVHNTIVAGNFAATAAEINNYNGSSTITTDHNLLGDNSHTHGQAFAGFSPHSSDINATSVDDAVSMHLPTAISEILEPLGNNGGASQTHALVVGSPALNMADGTVCISALLNREDQRSLPRNSVCDIGAYESQTSVTITVSNAADGTGSCTLRDAIESSNSDTAVGGCVAGNNRELIVFDPTEFPVAAANTITLTSPLPTINSDITITGQGTPSLTIDADDTGRVFYIYDSTVTLSDLTITGGSVTTGTPGGAIQVRSSVVNINNSTVSGSSSDGWGGGGLYARSGSILSLTNTTVSDNVAGFGGGIAVRVASSLNLNKSTVSANVGTNNTVRGGGIYLSNSDASLINSTVSGNFAARGGAGLSLSSGGLSLINSTVTNNSATVGGGGILTRSSSMVSLMNSIVAGNLSTSYAAIWDTNANSTFITSHNLLGDSSHTNDQAFSTQFTPSGSDITATSNGSRPTALLSIFDPLADNGGATQTHALVARSPAIGSAGPADCVKEDQRGKVRDLGGLFFPIVTANNKIAVISLDGDCDIGSYEFRGG